MPIQNDSGRGQQAVVEEPRDVAPEIEVSIKDIHTDERKAQQDEWDSKEPDFVHLYMPGSTTAAELARMGAEPCMRASDIPGSKEKVPVRHMSSMLVRRPRADSERQHKVAARLSAAAVESIADAEGDTTQFAKPRQPRRAKV